MQKYIESNLITESSVFEKIKKGEGGKEYDSEEYRFGDFLISRINVKKAVEKHPKGRYVTVYSPKIHLLSPSEQRELSFLVTNELRKLLSPYLPKDGRSGEILVVGIGNRDIASDSLGPLTAGRTDVTRHIKQIDGVTFEKMGRHSVSAINSGVMGETGMDTAEIIKGIVSKTMPDVIIAVDSLASAKTENLGAVIQICDSGISPGAGIGNRNCRVDRESVGVPVIAVGIPTVVSSATLVGSVLVNQGVRITASISEELERGRNFFVAPKECDIICKVAARVLADGINGATVCNMDGGTGI